MSINDNFIRVLPEAIRLTFYPTDPDNQFFYRQVNGEIIMSRSFWTTSDLIRKHHWEPFIMNTNSNVRKAINMGIVANASEILPPLYASNIPNAQRFKNNNKNTTRSTFNIQPLPPNGNKIPISKRTSVTDMLVSEWINPSSFLDITPPDHSLTSSPLALDSGKQAALFNIAVIEEDERIVRMRNRLKNLQDTLPNILGPLKLDLFNVRNEKEPAALPSPMKEMNTSPQLVSLPPIFNHPI